MKDHRLKIRITRTLLPLAVALALAACKPSLTGERLSDLAIDSTTAGEITSASPLNYNDGSHHQRYSVSLKAGQAVSLELSGALEGEVSVFDGNVLVARAANNAMMHDEHGGGSNSPTALAFKAPKDGKYTVAVSSASDKAFGPFSLKAATIKPYDGAALGADSQVIDWLTAPKQEYALKVAKAGIYAISMDSNVMDSFLRLTGKGVEVENDDSNGLNSKITTYLEPGDYVLTTSSMENRTGAFTLKVSMTAPAEGMAVRDGMAITLGQPMHGLLDSSGKRVFSLRITQAAQVQLDAISDSVDTVLKLTGPGVNTEDDDGGNGTNAQIIQSLSPGNYTVTVRSLGDNQGTFELQSSELGNASRRNSNTKDAAAEATEAAAEAASAVAVPAG